MVWGCRCFKPKSKQSFIHQTKHFGKKCFHYEYVLYALAGYYGLCFLLFIPIGILAKRHPNRYYRSGISCKCCYKSCTPEYSAAEKHYKEHPTTCIYCVTCCRNPWDLMYMNKKIGNGVSIDPPFKICALPVMYVVIWGVFLLFVEIHVLLVYVLNAMPKKLTLKQIILQKVKSRLQRAKHQHTLWIQKTCLKILLLITLISK